MLGALYATTLFFSIINATVIQPVIAAERAVSYRERAAGMYSVFPFTLALVSYFFLYRLRVQICPLLRLLQHLKVVCPCIPLSIRMLDSLLIPCQDVQHPGMKLCNSHIQV